MKTHHKHRYPIKVRLVTVEENQGLPYEAQLPRFMKYELEADQIPIFDVRRNILHVVRQGNDYFM
jgi:hypothetical protein